MIREDFELLLKEFLRDRVRGPVGPAGFSGFV